MARQMEILHAVDLDKVILNLTERDKHIQRIS